MKMFIIIYITLIFDVPDIYLKYVNIYYIYHNIILKYTYNEFTRIYVYVSN